MNQEPKIQEVDLIKVKVIKKKHIQNLRTRYPMAALDFTKLQMLAYISEWDSILYRDLETQHIGSLACASSTCECCLMCIESEQTSLWLPPLNIASPHT